MSFVKEVQLRSAQAFTRASEDPDEVKRGIDFLKKKGAENENSPLHKVLQKLLEILKELTDKDKDPEK